MVKIKRYSENDKSVWNEFNRQSKKPLFMFDRNYMDYHKDRFNDHSLMFFDDDKLIAIMPITESDYILSSHGGLTYGGIISDFRMKQHTMNDCFTVLRDYASENGFTKLIYKTIPHIYDIYPAEEDRYALFTNNAKLIKVEASTVVDLEAPLKMPKGRKAQISRAKREGVEILEVCDDDRIKTFINLENSVLSTRHNTRAVHSGDELALLMSRFPENIRLFEARYNGAMIAGTVVYEYSSVIHTQYMAANEKAREIGALDYVIDTVINKYSHSKKWLDFGISTEMSGLVLNEGLISQKESFGGRTNVYETWEIPLR